MPNAYFYLKVGEILKSSSRVPLSVLYDVTVRSDVYDIYSSCLKVQGRPHLAFVDKKFIDSPYQFVVNPSTTRYIEGVENSPIDFNDSLQYHYGFSSNFLPRSTNQGYMVYSIANKNCFSNKYLSKISYECGLGNNFSKEKFFNITLNTFKFKYMDGLINNKINLVMLNDGKKSGFISVEDLIKYVPKDQLQYLYFDPLEYSHFVENPLVKLGFNGVKGIITPENVYNYSKYGIKGLSSNVLLNNEIIFDDIGTGGV
jgi:hypothetical protein